MPDRSPARRRRLARVLLGGLLAVAAGHATAGDDATIEQQWEATRQAATSQVVYFNAWGGDLAINQYIAWAGERLQAEHGIELQHVKVTDIAESLTRVKAERLAGRDTDGSVDLLWINGENFAAMKRAGLLFGPWTDRLPNAGLIDWQGNPTTQTDGMLPTEGYELPWGTASLTLFYDAERIARPPSDIGALQRWIAAHPGRFSYPQPPAFVGTAFLKQLLLLLAGDPARLASPVDDDFDEVTRPLWSWLDTAHPDMWRSGRLFPQSGPAQRERLAMGELDWMLSYNPVEADRAIRQGVLHAAVRPLVLDGGALANSHFLAIPYNASAKPAAMVVANFFISPAAQLRKADIRYWGDPTVLDPAKLASAGREHPPAYGTHDASLLPEPHPSWTTRLEQAWLQRYVR